MILSGEEIKRQNVRNLVIEPFNPSQVNPNSYNLRLHNKLLVYDIPPWDILDMKEDNKTKEIIIPEEGLILYPDELYLGRTVERTKTDKYVPMLDGRSSVGRLGLDVHVTAGFGDVGFDGYWTLEIRATKPIRVYPWVEICQIYYQTIEGEYKLYGDNGKYQNNDGVQASMLWKDFEKKGLGE